MECSGILSTGAVGHLSEVMRVMSSEWMMLHVQKVMLLDVGGRDAVAE